MEVKESIKSGFMLYFKSTSVGFPGGLNVGCGREKIRMTYWKNWVFLSKTEKLLVGIGLGR